jgi:hypothetical protein
MTHQQKIGIRELMMELAPAEAHHGDCKGADATFHRFCKLFSCYIVGHPGVDRHGFALTRAYCDVDESLPPLPYLERDKVIVEVSKILIATPRMMIEEVRSGTWATVRLARKRNRTIHIVYPDGSRETEESK